MARYGILSSGYFFAGTTAVLGAGVTGEAGTFAGCKADNSTALKLACWPKAEFGALRAIS